MKKFILIGCGGIFGIFVILMLAGIVWLGSGPEGGVRLPNEMEAYAQQYLDDHNILEDSEELLAYYDVTLSCDGSEAAILTTKRVIYHKNGKNDSIDIVDIEDIRHTQESIIGDVFEIKEASGKTMRIEVAPLNQGETFKNVLMDIYDRANTQNKPD